MSQKPKDDKTLVDAAALGESIAAAIQATQGPRKVSFAEHAANKKLKNPKHKLQRPMFQNGWLLDAEALSNQEIDLLNAVGPGRYIDGLVEVVEKDKGSNRELHINYASKTIDQRMQLASHGVNSFAALLKRIVTEQN
jgi:hypothetical protein